MSALNDKTILLGVSGGIAAYKSCEVLRRLTDQGAAVHVILTASAQKFVTPLTFQSLSQNPVHTDLFSLTEESQMGHIKLADEADFLLIAPTTADLLAKMACGLADDLLTTAVLVTRAPVFLAPSMNVNMWEKEVVQNNLQILKNRGFHIIEPEEGFLACGWQGKGRMAEPEQILNSLIQKGLSDLPGTKKKTLRGKKILINAGPTREYLDPVRFISNPSSGKMGFALAAEAQARGGQVTLISGPSNLPTPQGVQRKNISNAQEMLAECQKDFPDSNIFIATAAVGDYRPKQTKSQKIKKKKDTLQVELVPNPDIIRTLTQQKRPGQLIIGFAAETENILENAKKKLMTKYLDMIIANDVSQSDIGFESNKNQVYILDPQGNEEKLPLLNKTDLAIQIWNKIETINSQRDSGNNSKIIKAKIGN